MEILTSLIPDFGSTFLVVFLLLLIFIATYQYVRFSGVPPGPRGLPLIGMTLNLQLSKNSWHFTDLVSAYNSDITSVPILGRFMIVLNTIESCKEVYQKRLDVQDRPTLSLFKTFDEDFTGVIATNGRIWKEARRFSIRMLRDFGMGKAGAESRILQESEILCEYVKNHDGALNPTKCFEVAVSNVICGLVFGRRFDASDEEFAQALAGMQDFLKVATSRVVFLLAQTRFGRDYVVKKRLADARKCLDQFRNFARKQIDEHKKTYNSQGSDLIYAFLEEMENGRDPEVFNMKMLESLVTDYFFAGSETTYDTIRWSILALCLHPDTQKKMQKELDDVLVGEMPTLDDRKNTPYCEAVLCEAQRFYSLIPQGPPHYNPEEITVNGYRIPKESLIVPNLYWIHHDPKVWKNPNNFDPENFFENGKLVNTERMIPFGVGRRSCAGEALARAEYYMFVVSLVKNFDMKLASCIPEDEDLVGRYTLGLSAVPFEVIFSVR